MLRPAPLVALTLFTTRRGLLFDTGRPRNSVSQALHGFLTRDGADPRELLLATGLVDNIPKFEGIEQFYGRSVFHCPYCDGWEVRDEPIAAYGLGAHGKGLALELTLWSKTIVLCTSGPAQFLQQDLDQLARNHITVREEKIVRLEGRDGKLERIVFDRGQPLHCRALFFNTSWYQRSSLPGKFGCDFTDKGMVKTGDMQSTKVPGLFVAGDAQRSVQLAIVAASEGAEAAFAINTELLEEDLK